MCDLTNDDNTIGRDIIPVGGPWAFINCIRILASGQVIEDINADNRVSEMHQACSATYNRAHAYARGFWQLLARPCDIREPSKRIPKRIAIYIYIRPSKSMTIAILK